MTVHLLVWCSYGVFLTLATTLAITLCEVRGMSPKALCSGAQHIPTEHPASGCKTGQVLKRTGSVCIGQYVPNAPPGYHGTTLYFYSRIVDICLGTTSHCLP
jgi:hypothetical protein